MTSDGGAPGAPCVLLVEDDPDDVFLVRHVFETVAPHVTLSVARDGEVAQAYLAGEPPYDDRTRHPVPDLVLLDIKLPRMSGLDVLAWLRDESDLPTLPVLMLSSSTESADVSRAYALGANGYLAKEGDVQALEFMVTGIVAYVEALAEAPVAPALTAPSTLEPPSAEARTTTASGPPGDLD